MSTTREEEEAAILPDERIAAVGRGEVAIPAGWSSRALYVGESGARHWLSVVHEPGYPLRDPDALGLRGHRLAAIAGLRPGTIVSLGPGDGSADADLLAASQDRPGYIAVDLSRPLLEAAIERLRPIAGPVHGVLCDFEEDGGLLGEVLARQACRPILFAMLGGTLGNLDGGEARFLDRIRGLMQPGDALLADLPLAGPGWSVEVEPRLRATAYTPAFRAFLLGDGAGEGAFEDRVGFAHRRDADTAAEVIEVTDRPSGRRLLTFRRYRREAILEWLAGRGFRVAFARSSFAPPAEAFGMGVVLLTT
ncbi:L-histidine N(alpha)-methyltransferase [Aquisphaera insulae]|uniref:L-histidine N(alpha)-methyltransferase n=1 Tax=Aquisphaera insulae TaxID=2712864 RepID=UPI0013EE2583|nr:L-histidine N(alpha)-methyltransferase [Aquisphaera insulae]